MKKIFKDKDLLTILIGAVFFLACLIVSLALPGQYMVLGTFPLVSSVLALLAMGVAGAQVWWTALKKIFRGDLLDETFLMSVASIAAFCLGEYVEGVAVILFFRVGEYFEKRAVRRSRAEIRALMDINPDTATLLRNGNEVEVEVIDVAVGDTVVLHAGDRVPVDCTVTRGTATVNTSALTGESLPLDAEVGTALLSGMIVNDALLYAEATRVSDESAAARVLALVEEANERKSRQERFITAFSRIYTPIVVGLAALIAVVPPLITGFSMATFLPWLRRALMLLVVSCPCALVISVPLAFFGGIGNAASQGILFKSGAVFDALAKAKIAVFDKTGTLTRGDFAVSEVHPVGVSAETLLTLAGSAEHGSTHPVSMAIRRSAPHFIPPAEVQELAGKGVIATVDGERIAVGNTRLMHTIHAPYPADAEGILVARERTYIGSILVTDTVKPTAKEAIELLRRDGIEKTVLLTGDHARAANPVGEALALDTVCPSLMPEEKFERLETLMNANIGTVLYAGDGINDAPSLARADVGIAMGGMGSDAAIEAADVVIMNDDPRKISRAIGVARRTLKIAGVNIAFALTVKIVVMVLASLGLLDFSGGMWIAVFADVGVALLCILNSLRMVFQKK